MRIYTRTGDRGETGLIGGSRVTKADQRIVAYGSIDELNSSIGIALASLASKAGIFSDIINVLTRLQNDLFILGSDLADPDYPSDRHETPRVDKNMALELEPVIDGFEKELEPISFFILPGGSIESSLLHQSRAVARRAETAAVALSKGQSINPAILVYLNRLSDLLFVAARLVNKRLGKPDVAWHGSAKR